MNIELSVFLDRVRPAIDAILNDLLPPGDQPPERLHQAMRYSTVDGGKRIRPALCVAAFSACDSDWTRVLPVAAAIEMVHSYSLIHDDLPAMDDDDFRRGKPTNHKVFGEAIAILAGDALLTGAIEVLAAGPYDADTRCRLLHLLTQAAGTSGMIGGQVLD